MCKWRNWEMGEMAEQGFGVFKKECGLVVSLWLPNPLVFECHKTTFYLLSHQNPFYELHWYQVTSISSIQNQHSKHNAKCTWNFLLWLSNQKSRKETKRNFNENVLLRLTKPNGKSVFNQIQVTLTWNWFFARKAECMLNRVLNEQQGFGRENLLSRWNNAIPVSAAIIDEMLFAVPLIFLNTKRNDKIRRMENQFN